jgi:hypothetical protein
MAAGDRTDGIFGRVQLTLGTLDWKKLALIVKNIPNQLIYDLIDQAQQRIAEDTLCIEKSTTTLAVSSGVASEPTGFFRIKLLLAPSGKTCQLQEVDPVEWDFWNRATSVTAQTPSIYKRYGGSITFWPTPDDGNYSLLYFGTPTTNVTTAIDPETPVLFDKAIEYAVVRDGAAIVGRVDLVPIYATLYQQELARIKERYRAKFTDSTEITYHEF